MRDWHIWLSAGARIHAMLGQRCDLRSLWPATTTSRRAPRRPAACTAPRRDRNRRDRPSSPSNASREPLVICQPVPRLLCRRPVHLNPFSDHSLSTSCPACEPTTISRDSRVASLSLSPLRQLDGTHGQAQGRLQPTQACRRRLYGSRCVSRFCDESHRRSRQRRRRRSCLATRRPPALARPRMTVASVRLDRLAAMWS